MFYRIRRPIWSLRNGFVRYYQPLSEAKSALGNGTKINSYPFHCLFNFLTEDDLPLGSLSFKENVGKNLSTRKSLCTIQALHGMNKNCSFLYELWNRRKKLRTFGLVHCAVCSSCGGRSNYFGVCFAKLYSVLAGIFFTGHGDHNNLVYFVYGRYSLIVIVILHVNSLNRSAFWEVFSLSTIVRP